MDYYNSPDNLKESEKKYEYLHSKERIEHLRRIVNGRPVAILAAGPSIQELERRIGELSQTDICYFGINSYFVQEEHILKKINKRFSVLSVGTTDILISTSDKILMFDKVLDFLKRDADNIFISSFYANRLDLLGPDFDLQGFLNKYNNKLLFLSLSTDRTVPNNNRPMHFLANNTLAVLINIAVIGGASKIILFGADGYIIEKDPEKTYYRFKEYVFEKYRKKEKSRRRLNEMLMDDTNQNFNPLVPLSLRNIYKTHHLEPVPIINCSEVSFYTPFPKMAYNDAFAFLKGEKTLNGIADLRVPTASIIIFSSGNNGQLKDILENLAKQSYSNYETIVIQNKNNLSFLDEIKRALSLAKGKYIFYCPAGNSYLDQDWINSCLEILENQPQVSLVCGIPQDQLANPPWPREKFLYYWLKKKNYFPANAFCVQKQVLEKCLLPEDHSKTDTEFADWLNFNLRFNVAGYLPAFIPTAVSYQNIEGGKDLESLNTYKHKIDLYKNRLIFKKTSHQFKDGDDNILKGKFSLSVFLFYNSAKKIETKLLYPLYPCLNTLKQTVRGAVKRIVMKLLKLTPPALERKTIDLYQSLKKKRRLRKN